MFGVTFSFRAIKTNISQYWKTAHQPSVQHWFSLKRAFSQHVFPFIAFLVEVLITDSSVRMSLCVGVTLGPPRPPEFMFL